VKRFTQEGTFLSLWPHWVRPWVSLLVEDGPERGEYAPFEAWLSYVYLPVVLRTQLKLPSRNRGLARTPDSDGCSGVREGNQSLFEVARRAAGQSAAALVLTGLERRKTDRFGSRPKGAVPLGAYIPTHPAEACRAQISRYGSRPF
jgi:hypothetical protein